MDQDAADFFNAEITTQKARLAKIEANARASGFFARQQWREAVNEAIREGRAICQRSTRQIYRPWDGRMGALADVVKANDTSTWDAMR